MSQEQLLGRLPELKVLDRAFDRAVQYRAPQTVTILGERGLGKSLLLRHWTRRAEEAGARIYRAQASGEPWGLVAGLLRSRMGLSSAMDRSVAMDRLRAVVGEVFADRRIADVSHFLGHFLPEAEAMAAPELPLVQAIREWPVDGETIARRVLGRFLRLDAERAPVLLACDDLDRADAKSLALLDEVVSGMAGVPILLLGTARPELAGHAPRWGTVAGPGCDQIRIELPPLDRTESERLLCAIMGIESDLPRSISDAAFATTAGNPRFVEQLARAFLAEGVVRRGAAETQFDIDRACQLQLPLTAEEAVQVRLEVLSPEERDLLEKGATFGSVFWTGGLLALRRREHEEPAHPFHPARREEIEGILGRLVDRDYLVRLPDSTIPGEMEYAFSHPSEREQITALTPAKPSQQNHLVAAQWFESRAAGEHEDQLEFLAPLYERGGLPQRAAQLWLRAGDRARAREANRRAAECYRRGLDLLGPDDLLGRLDALHNLGDVTALAGQTRAAIALFEEMLRAAWILDHPNKAGAAQSRLGRAYRTLGDFSRAELHLAEALSLFQQAGDERGVAGAEDDLGQILFLRGDFAQAIERLQRALALRQEVGDARSIALSLHNLGQVHDALGEEAEALAHLEKALALRRLHGDRRGIAHSLIAMGRLRRDRGHYDEALQVYREAIALSREIGDLLTEARVGAHIGELLHREGRFREAAAALERAVAVAEEIGDSWVQGEALRLLGETELELAEQGAARGHCTQALELAEEMGSRPQQGRAHRALGVALGRALSGPESEERAAAEYHFRTAVDLLRDLGAEAPLQRAYRDYGDFLDSLGEREAAHVMWERASVLQGGRPGVSIDIEI